MCELMRSNEHTEKRHDGTPAGLFLDFLIALRLTLDKLEHKPDLRVDERVQHIFHWLDQQEGRATFFTHTHT